MWSCDYYSCIKGDVLGNGEDFVVGFRWEVDYYEVKFFLFCIFKELFYGFGYEGIVLYDRLIFWNEEVYVYDFDRSYLIYEVCIGGIILNFLLFIFLVRMLVLLMLSILVMFGLCMLVFRILMK